MDRNDWHTRTHQGARGCGFPWPGRVDSVLVYVVDALVNWMMETVIATFAVVI